MTRIERLWDRGSRWARLLALLSFPLLAACPRQARIERAAALLPIDPAIGLEAGVIAMLAGHEEAARRSWQSVVAAAPDSAEAQTAKGYIAQLRPATPVDTQR